MTNLYYKDEEIIELTEEINRQDRVTVILIAWTIVSIIIIITMTMIWLSQ